MIYTIEKGRHRSSLLPKFTFKSYVKGSFKFIGDFSYEINTQEDSNKLIGLSDSWSHHRDSIRIGWRWNNGIELTVIGYVKGRRTIQPLSFIEANKDYKFDINIANDLYYIGIYGDDLFYEGGQGRQADEWRAPAR